MRIDVAQAEHGVALLIQQRAAELPRHRQALAIHLHDAAGVDQRRQADGEAVGLAGNLPPDLRGDTADDGRGGVGLRVERRGGGIGDGQRHRKCVPWLEMVRQHRVHTMFSPTRESRGGAGRGCGGRGINAPPGLQVLDGWL